MYFLFNSHTDYPEALLSPSFVWGTLGDTQELDSHTTTQARTEAVKGHEAKAQTVAKTIHRLKPRMSGFTSRVV